MSTYREYRIRVLIPYGGPDQCDALRDACFDAVKEEHPWALVTVRDPVERTFSDLTASEAEEVTRYERLCVDDDEGPGR